MARRRRDRHPRRDDGAARAEGRGRGRAAPGGSSSATREIQLIDVLAGRARSTSWPRPSTSREQGRGRARRLGARIAGRPRRGRRAAGRSRDRPCVRRRRRRSTSTVADARGRRAAGRSTRRSSGSGCCRRSTSGMRAGRGEFLAELRPAYPLFLRFGGIDYDDDDDAIAKLDDFVRRAQRIMAGYGGNVLQLTLGDKGAYLYGGLRLAARPRGRRRARGGCGARAARSRADDAMHATSRSASPTAACAAARTATRCGGRSSASATR